MKNDKLKHFIVGVGLGSATYFSNHWLLGLGISSSAFIGKEIFDKYKKNPTGFDEVDLFVDYLGFVIGFGASGFLHGLIGLI